MRKSTSTILVGKNNNFISEHDSTEGVTISPILETNIIFQKFVEVENFEILTKTLKRFYDFTLWEHDSIGDGIIEMKVYQKLECRKIRIYGIIIFDEEYLYSIRRI